MSNFHKINIYLVYKQLNDQHLLFLKNLLAFKINKNILKDLLKIFFQHKFQILFDLISIFLLL